MGEFEQFKDINKKIADILDFDKLDFRKCVKCGHVKPVDLTTNMCYRCMRLDDHNIDSIQDSRGE